MTKIAYKVNTTNPNLPNGFIIDHFDTDQDQVEGYIVVDQSVFDDLIQSNVQILRQHEANQSTSGAPQQGIPVHPRRDASEAQPIDPQIMAQKNQSLAQAQADTQLFQQFLEWKKSQGSNS